MSLSFIENAILDPKERRRFPFRHWHLIIIIPLFFVVPWLRCSFQLRKCQDRTFADPPSTDKYALVVSGLAFYMAFPLINARATPDQCASALPMQAQRRQIEDRRLRS